MEWNACDVKFTTAESNDATKAIYYNYVEN